VAAVTFHEKPSLTALLRFAQHPQQSHERGKHCPGSFRKNLSYLEVMELCGKGRLQNCKWKTPGVMKVKALMALCNY